MSSGGIAKQMRVQLLAADGTLLFVGVVNPRDDASHITYTDTWHGEARLRCDVVDPFTASGAMRLLSDEIVLGSTE